MTVLDVVAAVLVVFGGLLVAIAGLGVLVLPDTLSRMSAVTKAATLGVALILVGAWAESPSVRAAVIVMLAVVVQVITVPVAGLALGRAAYRTGAARTPVVRVDEPAELSEGPAHDRR